MYDNTEYNHIAPAISATMAGICYFDITDLLDHTINNDRLTGIQRASVYTLFHLAKSANANNYRLIAFHPIMKLFVSTDLSFFRRDDFDIQAFKRFFVNDKWRYHSLELFLGIRYSNGNIRRLQRLRMLIKNKLTNGRYFRRKGIYTVSSSSSEPKNAIWVEDDLTRNDVLYLPGSTWGKDIYLKFIEEQHKKKGISIVVFVHDLVPIYAPEFVPDGTTAQFVDWLNSLCAITSKFIVNSESTRSDLRRFINEFNHKNVIVVVAPLAHEFPGFERVNQVNNVIASACDSLLIFNKVRNKIRCCTQTPFVLCVGTFQPRKNNVGLLRVWQKIHETLGYETPRLVFAGTNGWMNDEFFDFLRNTAKVWGTVSIVEGPSDIELAYLYSKCLFSVYPSFAEGWGLPIGESLWFGRPVIASNATSMPEVGGDYVDYVDPLDLATIETAILRMLEPKYRATRANAIKTMSLRTWTDFSQSICAELLTSSESAVTALALPMRDESRL